MKFRPAALSVVLFAAIGAASAANPGPAQPNAGPPACVPPPMCAPEVSAQRLHFPAHALSHGSPSSAFALETRGLRWAAMSRETGSNALILLQSDGAVVEEFRIRKLGHMMGFDAGTYEPKP